MAATKITVNNNGSIRIEGDFEIVDPAGQEFGLGGARPRLDFAAAVRRRISLFAMVRITRLVFNDVVTARDLPAPKPKV